MFLRHVRSVTSPPTGSSSIVSVSGVQSVQSVQSRSFPGPSGLDTCPWQVSQKVSKVAPAESPSSLDHSLDTSSGSVIAGHPGRR